MGLIVHVLKESGEREERTLVGYLVTFVDRTGDGPFEPIDGPFEPSEARPAVLIAAAPMGNRGVYDAVPAGEGWARERRHDAAGPMCNGRFVWTSDSRFPASLPLRYFDRWETPAQYATYD